MIPVSNLRLLVGKVDKNPLLAKKMAEYFEDLYNHGHFSEKADFRPASIPATIPAADTPSVASRILSRMPDVQQMRHEKQQQISRDPQLVLIEQTLRQELENIQKTVSTLGKRKTEIEATLASVSKKIRL